MKPITLLRRAQFHGANRLVEPRHRAYWAVALLFLLWAALSNLGAMVVRFLITPTHIIMLDTVSTVIPFPAVLVCPEVRFAQEKIDKLLQIAKYPKGMNATSIGPLIQQVAAFFSPDVPYTILELSEVLEFLEFNDLDVETTGAMLTTSCEEILIRCRYLWMEFDCTQIFHMELTLYGFCCVFNGKSLKREKQRNFRQSNKNNRWYTTEVGPLAALVVAINQSQIGNNVDLSYKWLVVQSSQRYVDITKNGTPISPGSEQWSSFWIRHLFIAEDSRYMSDKIRGCQLDNKPLKYFPVYSRKSCLFECRMRLMMHKCQCLLPFHYRPYGIPLCHALSLPCARRAQVAFDSDICDCPYTCEYQSEMTDTTTYHFSKNAKPYDSFYHGLDLSKVTVSRVYIKSHETISYVRRSYFSFHDLFAQLGGVFNVFFGCSILTIFELLQLACYSCRLQATRIAGKEKDVLMKPIPTKKKKAPLFGLCCRKKQGRVVKRKACKKKVAFFKFKGKNEVQFQFQL